MERSNIMSGREKRKLDSSSYFDSEDGQHERKRPALASVIVEALKVDSLQRLFSSLEPVLRRVVSEEVERALAKLGPARLVGDRRSSPKRIEASNGPKLQLHFKTRLSLPLFTGGKVEGEQGAGIHLVLLDAKTGHLVTTGPESCAKLDVVVLEGDFNYEDDVEWTREEFDSHVVKEREGKRPLLTGDLQVKLKEGVGTLGELTFTDNSSWVRSRQFRLGIRVSEGCCDGVRIREANTEAFTVKDHRGELYKKHYPPSLNDEVWRLEKIGKDGAFHKRLNNAGIITVEDFLRSVVRDPPRLRNILGGGMSTKMWDTLVEHAKTCVLSGNMYIYYPDGPQGVGVIFNTIYEFIGLIASGQFYSTESLSCTQKIYADTLIKKAYDDWIHVVEFDSESLLSLKPNQIEDSTRIEPLISQTNPNFYGHQLSLPNLPAAPSIEQPSVDPTYMIGGLHDALGQRYSEHSQTTNHNGSSHFNSDSFLPPNQFIDTSGLTQPSISNNGSSLSGLQPFGTPDFYRENENMLCKEEIRLKSNQMLEHEDMQHVLRVFGIGGCPSQNPVENGYPFLSGFVPSPVINFDFGEERGQSSGKAIVGWLKLKAAFRWGIFIRKKAAQRRAQLVELDDI